MLQTPERGPALCICCFPAWTIQIELIEGRQQEGKGELCYWLYHLTPVDTKDGKLDLALVAVRLDKVWMGSELMLLGMGVGFAALEDFASGSKVRGYSSSWLACACVGFLPLHPWPGQLDFASVMAGLERNQSTAFLVVSSFFFLFFPLHQFVIYHLFLSHSQQTLLGHGPYSSFPGLGPTFLSPGNLWPFTLW